jgi:hypothetical protein
MNDLQQHQRDLENSGSRFRLQPIAETSATAVMQIKNFAAIIQVMRLLVGADTGNARCSVIQYQKT